MEVCLRAIVAALLVAGSMNACDDGAAGSSKEASREEERVREAQRENLALEASVRKLEQELESARSLPVTPPPGPLPDDSQRAEIRALLSAAKASAAAHRQPPPKCTCKRDDPLCDCD